MLNDKRTTCTCGLYLQFFACSYDNPPIAPVLVDAWDKLLLNYSREELTKGFEQLKVVSNDEILTNALVNAFIVELRSEKPADDLLSAVYKRYVADVKTLLSVLSRAAS